MPITNMLSMAEFFNRVYRTKKTQMVTYIQVISHVKQFWFAEVDIRKKVVHLNHLFIAGKYVARQGYYKAYVQQPPAKQIRGQQ